MLMLPRLSLRFPSESNSFHNDFARNERLRMVGN